VQATARNSDRLAAVNSSGVIDEDDAGYRQSEIILLVAVLFLALAGPIFSVMRNMVILA
jgi:hypothetical protein